MEKTKSNEKVSIPDGKYYALWSAYTINVLLPDFQKIDIKINHGVKGVNCKCTVEIIDGWLYVID